MIDQPLGGEGTDEHSSDGGEGQERRARVIAVAVVVPLVLVVAAVAVFRGNDGTPRKLPVATVGEASGAGLADARAAVAAPYGGVRYVAGPDLPALEGKAHAYKVTGSVDAAGAAEVAKAFGIKGDVQEEQGSFLVTDGVRRVYVYGAGFSYEGQLGGVVASTASCFPVPPDSSRDAYFCDPSTTVPPSRPAGFPTEDQARATALAALRAAGVAVDGARVTAVDDGYQWQITVAPVIDGMVVAGLQANASVTDAGITYASGSLGRPEKVDEYPLIGTAKAIEHLNDGTALFGPALGTYETASATGGDAATASDAPACAANADCAPSTGAGSPGYACPAIAAVPPETVPPCPPLPAPDPSGPPTTVPGPPPEPTVITLTGAELGLMLAPSGQTDSYLLPAYLFSTADGPGPMALAIDSSWLEPLTPPTVSTGSGTPGSEVPCSTPGATGPCTVGPPETGSIEPAPPTTCGPPVQSANADAPAPGSPADKIGCPIN